MRPDTSGPERSFKGHLSVVDTSAEPSPFRTATAMDVTFVMFEDDGTGVLFLDHFDQEDGFQLRLAPEDAQRLDRALFGIERGRERKRRERLEAGWPPCWECNDDEKWRDFCDTCDGMGLVTAERVTAHKEAERL